MLNVKNITEALKNQLIAANTENRRYVIGRNAAYNTDPNQSVEGWVGIYRDAVNYEPHSSGPRPWLAEVKIRLELQVASIAGGEACEDLLDSLEEFVMNAIESDKTIGGYVALVTGYNFDYDEDIYVNEQQIYFQTSTLTITAEVRA